MKNVFEHIAYVKEKPHHIRRQIAFASAAAGAGVIALVWFVASISTGAFAINGSSFADIATGEPVTVVEGTGLAGAAAAVSDYDGPARIEIVDTAPSTPAKKPEQTTLPF